MNANLTVPNVLPLAAGMATVGPLTGVANACKFVPPESVGKVVSVMPAQVVKSSLEYVEDQQRAGALPEPNAPKSSLLCDISCVTEGETIQIQIEANQVMEASASIRTTSYNPSARDLQVVDVLVPPTVNSFSHKKNKIDNELTVGGMPDILFPMYFWGVLFWGFAGYIQYNWPCYACQRVIIIPLTLIQYIQSRNFLASLRDRAVPFFFTVYLYSS